MPEPPAGWVDIHHHAYHPKLVEAMRGCGVTEMAPSVPVPKWTVEDSLQMMETHDLTAAVLSVLLPDAAHTHDGVVRVANECSAELVREWPGRFGVFATVPMPHVDRSLAEIEYAFDVLHVDGVVLSASTADGRYLGDPTLDPVLEELNRRSAVVFVHPNPSSHCRCTGGPELTRIVPPPLVDFVMDTTRAVANLLFRGALSRFPNITFVLAHAGGAVPYLAWRLELAGTWVLAHQRGGREDVAAQLRRLYYETAQSASEGVLACLRTVTEASHILFGTDFPFMSGAVVAATRDRVGAAAGTGWTNPLTLLPGLRNRLLV